MEKCPHCQKQTFSSKSTFWFGREGKIITCPSCGGKSAIPRLAKLMGATLIITYLIDKEFIADFDVSLITFMAISILVAATARIRFALIPVTGEADRPPVFSWRGNLRPALIAGLAMLLIPYGIQFNHYLNKYDLEDLIRGKHDNPYATRPVHIDLLDFALRLKYANSDIDPATPTSYGNETYLTLAAKNRDLSLVKALARPGTAIDEPNSRDETALFIALEQGDFEMADVLKAAGADVNRRDMWNQVMLQEFSQSPYLSDPTWFVLQFSWLLENGADVSDPKVNANIYSQGNKMQKALLAWAGADIPATHTQEAQELKQWLIDDVKASGFDERLAHEYAQHPFTVAMAERENRQNKHD